MFCSCYNLLFEGYTTASAGTICCKKAEEEERYETVVRDNLITESHVFESQSIVMESRALACPAPAMILSEMSFLALFFTPFYRVSKQINTEKHLG